MCLLRIVVYGDDMLRAIVPNSARTFNFQKIFGLSYEQVCRCTSVLLRHQLMELFVLSLKGQMLFFIFQALKVSDHYPVEVELKSLSYVEGNLRIHCMWLISVPHLKKEKNNKT